MKKRKTTYWLSAVIGLSVLAVSCQKQAPPAFQTGPIPVSLDTVEMQKAIYFDQYPGNVVALNEVEMRSEVNGFITDISFEEGHAVHKGQKLYTIEQSKYAAAYAQANASLKIARANLEKAQNDAGRYNRLGEQGMATKQRVEYAATDVENAKMQVASAEAGLERAAVDLKHATITAPFDGTIGFSMVKKGAYITSGQTLLNTISSDNPMAVDFNISEKEINRFLQLKQQKQSNADSLFTIVLADKSVYPYPGKIEFFDRAVDPQTATLKVRLSFPNPNQQLKAGMSVNIKVRNSNSADQIVIPYKAVTEQMGEFFVYVVDKDTAWQHKVILSSPIKDRIIVREGLNVGERIVVDGIQKLRNGTAVLTGSTPTQAPAPASK